MCYTVIIGDKEIKTVDELIDEFDVKNINYYHATGYGKIKKDGCLCQIYLLDFFRDKGINIKFFAENSMIYIIQNSE